MCSGVVVDARSAFEDGCEWLGQNNHVNGDSMSNTESNKMDSVTVSDGGDTSRRTSAEAEFERAARALFYAMCGKDGKSINRNFRNITKEGGVTPFRVVVRRFKEAKLARAPKAYEKQKSLVRAFDDFVDALHGKARQAPSEQRDTGDFPRAA